MSFFRRLSEAFKRLKKASELEHLSDEEIRLDGWGRWIVYRFNENRPAGMIVLGILPLNKAVQEASKFGNVVKVDEDYCFIFINDNGV